MKLYIYIAASVASVSFAAGYLVASNWRRREKRREKRRDTQTNHTNKVETVLLLGTLKLCIDPHNSIASFPLPCWREHVTKWIVL